MSLSLGAQKGGKGGEFVGGSFCTLQANMRKEKEVVTQWGVTARGGNIPL